MVKVDFSVSAEQECGMGRKPAQKTNRTKTAKAPRFDFSLDALQGEAADPSPVLIQSVARAIEQIREGAAWMATIGREGQESSRARNLSL